MKSDINTPRFSERGRLAYEESETRYSDALGLIKASRLKKEKKKAFMRGKSSSARNSQK